MELSKLSAGREGYLVDTKTGQPVRFYLCDPEKNIICDHSMCRYPCQKEDDSEIGFCVSTPIQAFRRSGTGPFYFRLDSRGEYIQDWVEEDDDDQS